jgi:hypothetical protein
MVPPYSRTRRYLYSCKDAVQVRLAWIALEKRGTINYGDIFLATSAMCLMVPVPDVEWLGGVREALGIGRPGACGSGGRSGGGGGGGRSGDESDGETSAPGACDDGSLAYVAVNGLTYHAHTLFGPLPFSTVYHSTTRVAVGDITGQLLPSQVKALADALAQVSYHLEDKDNALVEAAAGVNVDPSTYVKKKKGGGHRAGSAVVCLFLRSSFVFIVL